MIICLPDSKSHIVRLIFIIWPVDRIALSIFIAALVPADELLPGTNKPALVVFLICLSDKADGYLRELVHDEPFQIQEAFSWRPFNRPAAHSLITCHWPCWSADKPEAYWSPNLSRNSHAGLSPWSLDIIQASKYRPFHHPSVMWPANVSPPHDRQDTGASHPSRLSSHCLADLNDRQTNPLSCCCLWDRLRARPAAVIRGLSRCDEYIPPLHGHRRHSRR